MSASGITPYPVPCAQQCRHTVGQPATSMHRYSIAVAPGSPGPVTVEPSRTASSSRDRPRAPNLFFDGRLTGLLACPQWLPVELNVLLGLTASHHK
jgi:hypothetical protein